MEPPSTLKVDHVVKYFYEPEKFQVLKDCFLLRP